MSRKAKSRKSILVAQEQVRVPEMLTVRQVCGALHISRSTLYRRPYRYTQENGARKRLYFADDIRIMLLLNTTTPESPKDREP